MITLKPSVYREYQINLAGIQTLDSSGEYCEYCSDEGSTVEVQAYASVRPEVVHELGEMEVYVECCAACLGYALLIATADAGRPVTVEFENSTPVGPPAGTEAGA
jgi:hypothetical protein